MIKKSTKKKTVEYESKDIICDLCEAEVPTGQAIIQLTPFIAEEQGGRFGGIEATKIDICSVDCMVKNAGAAGLLLNTKILPDLRGRLKKPQDPFSALLAGLDNNDTSIKKAFADKTRIKKGLWADYLEAEKAVYKKLS